jgi:hypothetical protein
VEIREATVPIPFLMVFHCFKAQIKRKTFQLKFEIKINKTLFFHELFKREFFPLFKFSKRMKIKMEFTCNLTLDWTRIAYSFIF